MNEHRVQHVDATRPRPIAISPATNGRKLRADTELTLTIDDLRKLQSIHDPITIDEVIAIYLPLSRLLALYVAATQGLFKATQRFLGADDGQGALHHRRRRLGRGRQVDDRARAAGPAVALAEHAQGAARHDRRLSASQRATDRRRAAWSARAFPRATTATALIRFLADVKAGERNVTAPVYSHLVYDVVPGETDRRRPARHPHRRGAQRAAAQPAFARGQGDPVRLGLLRFFGVPRRQRGTAGKMVRRALHAPARHRVSRSAQLLHQVRRARRRTRRARRRATIWRRINLVNLRENILPTRPRASLRLMKGPSHRIEQVALRKL